MSQQTSRWFNIQKYHPAQPGVYELITMHGFNRWSYWNGFHWLGVTVFAYNAEVQTEISDRCYNGTITAWRGLAVKP